jgi:hypothetical protein
MSEMDMDARPRMKDYLKPEDLSTEGCITLAQTILGEAGKALMHAVRRYNEWPSPENHAHLETCRAFYRSDLFVALSCGVADGETVIRQLTKQALLGGKGMKV